MDQRIDFAAIFKSSPNCYFVMTPDFTILEANDAYLRAVGRTREELVGRNLFDAFPGDPANPDDSHVQELRASFERARTRKAPDAIALIRYAIPRDTPEGTVFDDRYWSAVHYPVLDERGEVAFLFQHTQDVTETESLKRALRAAGIAQDDVARARLEERVARNAEEVQKTNRLLDAEQRHLRRLFQQAPTFTAVLSGPRHVFELANTAYSQLVGHRELIGKPVREALPEIAGQGFFELLDRVYATAEPFVGREVRVTLQRQPDGALEEVYLDFIYQPIVETDGSVSGIFLQGHDITAQKRAQDELRGYRDRLEELVRERTRALEQSEAERREAEASLRHAQRLEAVGQLTGGVAHDFNNVLQVIGGNLQLLRGALAGNETALRRLNAAIGGVERGARLASQLLAFARRQPLEPVVLNLGGLLRRMDDLIRRSLGEAIEIETVVAGGLWNTLVDPNHLENIILNLAINARDAMAGEGKLTIEVGNAMLDEPYAALHPDVRPGQYVMLAVTDTGAGMSKEVRERAFEPFFTTKPVGQGTGLGLSMVYGFVKQSGGHVKIYSEEGHGTSVKIYLPRSRQPETEVAETVSGPVEGGTETILVVEDDAEVRNTAVEILADLGYRVLKACDGQSALAILDSGVSVDLLFTDVVMPGPLRSTELARRAKALLPHLEVLFTSGYTENAIVHGGRLDPGVNLLSKPYRREDLARKLRHMFRNRQQLLDLQAETAKPKPPASLLPEALSILFVEDNEDLQLLISEFLKTLGHRLTVSSTAEEALAALTADTFDVLFTDIGLPRMSGMELAEKAMAIHPHMRLVIASGYGDTVNVAPLGRNAVRLPKPYDLEAVQRVLADAARALSAPAGS